MSEDEWNGALFQCKPSMRVLLEQIRAWADATTIECDCDGCIEWFVFEKAGVSYAWNEDDGWDGDSPIEQAFADRILADQAKLARYESVVEAARQWRKAADPNRYGENMATTRLCEVVDALDAKEQR